MKNENFKKRLALALVPILSLTSVIGNVPILPTSVFAVTQDEVYIEEPMVIEEETLEVEEPAEVEETLEVEEPAVIVEETEEVEEPEALLNEVPENLQNLPVINMDVLNAASTLAITGEAEDSKLEYKVGAGDYTDVTDATTIDFTGIVGDVTFKVTNGTNKQVKTFTYQVGTEPVVPITLINGEATIENAIAKTITAINLEFEPAYTISWTAGTGGTLKIGTDDTSPYTSNGTQITATITPLAGKGIKEFKVDNVNKTADLTGTGPYLYTFTPTDNMTLAVTFDNKYDITWSVVGAGSSLSVNNDTDGTYAYINGEGEVTVKFTEAEGYVLTEFKVGTSNQTTAVKNGEYKFTPTKATALSAKFETKVCKIGSVGFASLTAAIAYINANGSAATDYTIDILDNIPSLALTLPSATKAKSITLKTAKVNGETPVPVDVAISNTTLAIPTELILDNVVLKASAVNLTLSAAASALTVKAGGGIDKVVNVTTAAGKVITLEDTTKFVITGNLSGKPNIILKDDLEIAGVAAIGELTYSAAAILKFTKTTTTATSTITKIATSGDFAAVLQAGILSLTIGDIDVDTSTTTGFVIKGRQYTATIDKTPVYKITGTISIATGKPIELSVYGKADTDYSALAAIDPTTAIITSVKTTKPAAAGDTTGAMFKTSNKNGTKDYAFYKDGTSLKLGNNFVEVLDGTTHKENFIRLQDALDYINTNKAALTTTVIKVSGDMPSHGALTFPEEDITIQSSNQYKVLFTGAVKLNGNLTLTDIELSNGNIKGIAFDLNGKNLTLGTDSKVIFNNIVDTTKVTGTDTKASKLMVTDSGDLTFLGAITAIGTVDIDDSTIFKGAVSNVNIIDIAADKYAYFRGGAITNKLAYGAGSIINLPSTATGGVTRNITIKDTTTSAVTGTGKLEVNAVKDKLTAAVAATATTPGVPEKITIETTGGGSEKVNPGAVVVKLVKDSKVLASSFVTDAKNFKLTTDQTLIATKAGTSIKIAAPKLTLTDTTDSGNPVNENFVTIEEALGVAVSGTTYKITITDNIVGADLTNIPAKVTVITAAKPTGTDPLLKVATSKDIGLNGGLTIENLNILAAAKTIGGRTSPSEGVYTYTDAKNDLVLSNASLTVKEGYIKDLTLQDDAIITFRGKGYLAQLILTKGSTVGKIASIPVPET